MVCNISHKNWFFNTYAKEIFLHQTLLVHLKKFMLSITEADGNIHFLPHIYPLFLYEVYNFRTMNNIHSYRSPKDQNLFILKWENLWINIDQEEKKKRIIKVLERISVISNYFQKWKNLLKYLLWKQFARLIW